MLSYHDNYTSTHSHFDIGCLIYTLSWSACIGSRVKCLLLFIFFFIFYAHALYTYYHYTTASWSLITFKRLCLCNLFDFFHSKINQYRPPTLAMNCYVELRKDERRLSKRSVGHDTDLRWCKIYLLLHWAYTKSINPDERIMIRKTQPSLLWNIWNIKLCTTSLVYRHSDINPIISWSKLDRIIRLLLK